MIRLCGLAKSFGGRQLFESIDWQLPSRGCWGLVGPNGVGKTTLMRLIMGLDEPDAGEVLLGRRTDVGYLPQEATVESREPLLEFIKRGAGPLLAMKAELDALIERLEGAPDHEKAAFAEEMTSLEEAFRRRGGWAIDSHARQIAVGMGFGHEDLDKPLDAFSGGWRMKALLSQLLLRSPDVLLLDEPTNHLDMESVEWLEQFLAHYPGAVILISHDRYFLNHVVQGIAELTPRQLYVRPGDYDRFVQWKEAERERIAKLAQQQSEEIQRIEQFVDRFRSKATKAAQVQSRLKLLDKIERVEVEAPQRASIQFRFTAPERMGKLVVDAQQLTKRFGQRSVYQRLDFKLHRGEKVAFVGPNGAGKSTLLKMLAGALSPDEGVVELGFQVTSSYFAQHSVDQLDLSLTLVEEMNRWATPATSGQVRHILGAFGFSGDAVDKKIHVLSGGEKTRLALSKLLLRPAGLLLLDEPTNHLDVETRQILEEALRAFDGAICVISHDRYFLNQFVNRVVHIEGGRLTEYPGDYDYYKWRRAQDLSQLGAPGSSPGQGPQGQGSQEQVAAQELTGAEPVSNRKDLRRVLAQLRQEKQDRTRELRAQHTRVEADIATSEARQAALEAILADPSTYQRPDAADLQREYAQLQASLETLMTRWEQLQEQLDAIEAHYLEREEALRA